MLLVTDSRFKMKMATKSISEHGARTSVVQRKEEQSCQHFSLRGYVADMRVKDPKVGNPFGSFKNGESAWKRLRGPLDAPRRSLCENCVGGVVSSRTSVEKGLNAEQDSQKISIPGEGKNSTVEHRGTRDAIAGDCNKAPITVMNDSEDGVIGLTPSLEELTKGKEKVAAGNGVPTDALQQIEKRPVLDKGQEFDRQPQETRKAIGVDDNDLASGFLEPSRNLNRGPPYSQAVLDDLNARITSAANILRNQQQQRRNISSSSTVNLSLSLCIPGTEGNQKLNNEEISVESNKKSKDTVNALDNVSESSLKSRRQVEMGKFLGMPFTSCEIIDLESARVNTDGSPSPVITAYAKHANADPTWRNHAKATGESSLPDGEVHKGPVTKSSTAADPPVPNMVPAPNTGRLLYPMDLVCLINRNPADFSMADPENIYMN